MVTAGARGAGPGGGRPGAASLAWAALAGVVVYVAIDVLLAFLRPHYSLLYNAESDYGNGPWYWVMDLNFLLRCALSLALAGALARTAGLEAGLRVGLILLATWAVCSGLLAFFTDDLEGQRVHGSGAVHLLLAFVAFVCVTVATIVLAVNLRSDPRWRRTGTVLVGLSLAGVLALLLLGSGTGHHHHAPGGLYERIFLGIELLWIALAAAHVIVISRPARPAPDGVAPATVSPGR
jgi:hypothetical membrane protein